MAWYRKHRRDLPWRRTKDPYRIWVSEVMLQQTQVVTATPFYGAFIERFPDVGSLARAPLAAVLSAWSGLGYYRRARNLHAAAQQMVRDHAGLVPGDPGAFGELPGVGRYTVGAVLSIAFDRSLPVLDGNVARVLARIEGLPVSVRDPRGARTLWDRAEALMPAREPGDWNQALMELGATVCTPRAPSCPNCPVRRSCRAFAEGCPEAYPAAIPRPNSIKVRRAAALLVRGGRVWVVRRDAPVNEGLWEPPSVELAESAEAGPALRALLRGLGVRASLARAETRVRHSIMRHSIEVEVWQGVAAAAPRASAAGRWVSPETPSVPLTGLGRKLLRLAVRPRAALPPSRLLHASELG